MNRREFFKAAGMFLGGLGVSALLPKTEPELKHYWDLRDQSDSVYAQFKQAVLEQEFVIPSSTPIGTTFYILYDDSGASDAELIAYWQADEPSGILRLE